MSQAAHCQETISRTGFSWLLLAQGTFSELLGWLQNTVHVPERAGQPGSLSVDAAKQVLLSEPPGGQVICHLPTW